MHKYAFLDRDGNIIHEPDAPEGSDSRETFPLKSADEVRFLEGAIDGMKKLTEREYRLVLVTNQSYLGTDRHPKKVFDETMRALEGELASHGVVFSFVMVCPHGPDDGCACRKPATGGIAHLIDDIDTSRSFMFGDRDTDRTFAENLGIQFVHTERNGVFKLPEGV